MRKHTPIGDEEMLILNTIRIMEKKSPQNLAYMDFVARDSHNSMVISIKVARLPLFK
ncbi:MAG: hypothetical protein ACI4RH_09710 [Huintestinicola sp.]